MKEFDAVEEAEKYVSGSFVMAESKEIQGKILEETGRIRDTLALFNRLLNIDRSLTIEDEADALSEIESQIESGHVPSSWVEEAKQLIVSHHVRVLNSFNRRYPKAWKKESKEKLKEMFEDGDLDPRTQEYIQTIVEFYSGWKALLDTLFGY